jgi:hypothetical protein
MRNNKEYTVFFLTYHFGHSVFCYELRLDSEHLIPTDRTKYIRSKKSVLRIRIRDPVPFWALDPGSEMSKK